MKNRKKKTIIHICFLCVLALLFTASLYSKIEFGNESVEEYLFYAMNGIGSTDTSMIGYAVAKYFLPFAIIFIFLVSLFYNINPKRKFKHYPFRIVMEHKKIFTALVVLIVFCISLYNIHFYSYMYDNIATSKIIDDNYVALESDSLKQAEKRNLVLIYMESFETTFFSKEHGGEWDEELFPELYEIMKSDDTTYFSVNDKLQGTPNVYGTSWTTASIISSSSGLPFKVGLNNLVFDENSMLRKVDTLGDVLEEYGYKNEVVSGASTKFGGLYDYFTIHGNYEIIDPDTVDKYDIDVDYDTTGSWGFNDRYMFDLAKDRIQQHVDNNETFNETLISIDSHPIDGYKTEFTLDEYDTQYENVYATSALYLSEFIKWIQESDFYEDTTVVVIGDHLCMQTNIAGDKEERGRLNMFINSVAKTDNTKNRNMYSMDLYPTILSSIGFDIKDNQIGIGVNLFSNKKTLMEKYGTDYTEKELRKKSLLYNRLLKE